VPMTVAVREASGLIWPNAGKERTNATASAATRSMYKRFNRTLFTPHKKSNGDAKLRSPKSAEVPVRDGVSC
jgi:hypothetical protein